ncbi:MAG: hypothetical protein M3Y21_01820 [Candidatus Eremiobacteraeota bacterium]|nr:hypothetical protein [Candidatus Eremiobacteraeota bacterium]
MRTREEPRWHAAIAVVVALGLYVTLPPKLEFGPLWLVPALTLGAMIPLLLFSPYRHEETVWQRFLSIALIVVINLGNIASVILLVFTLLESRHAKSISGTQLMVSAAQIWLTNILVYALWFWEIDNGGPDARSRAKSANDFRSPDFAFPQMLVPDRLAGTDPNWKPRFLDYVFVSFTNATAFSPTDTFPLSHPAKMLFMAEAVTALVTIAVIAGRAVNILT